MKGASCDFCHAEHKKVSGLDKAQRMVMSRLSHSDKLRMLLPLLRSKARAGLYGSDWNQLLTSPSVNVFLLHLAVTQKLLQQIWSRGPMVLCCAPSPANLFPQQCKLMGSSAQNSSGVHWCRSRVRFNEVPEKVPKVPEKVWEALVQSQVTFNRVPKKVPERFWRRSGRLWC